MKLPSDPIGSANRNNAASKYIMSNTGLFSLHEVAGSHEEHQFSSIDYIQATCLSCNRSVLAKGLPELEVIKGGAILYCPGCGARQAISNARFDVFLKGTAPESEAPADGIDRMA